LGCQCNVFAWPFSTARFPTRTSAGISRNDVARHPGKSCSEACKPNSSAAQLPGVRLIRYVMLTNDCAAPFSYLTEL
jgi:hypothetical protein